MRMVSRTPQARSCCTTLLESYLIKALKHNKTSNESSGVCAQEAPKHFRTDLVVLGRVAVNTGENIILWVLTRTGAFHHWA